MKNPPRENAKRNTGIWPLAGSFNDRPIEEVPLPGKVPNPAEIVAGPVQNNGTIEFGGIRVKLITYRTIPGVILINAAKTMSEWMKLRALNHLNIISFDDEDSGTGHWLPTRTEGMNDNPEGQCELYIMRPPLPVSVAAAAAQYPFSIMDAHRMCKDLLNALKYLASHELLRGDFDANHVIVTREGFKLGMNPEVEALKIG
ncbi:hypothetical protein CJF30_00010854 [Rutstroemia sp. NJR-2017a BBW]|nr:hypothetical protein CJF30_00010854 [Rutstroemia sp. NJR-2017a BBW]